MTDAINTLLDEERRYPPRTDFAAQANAKADIYDRDFDEFWDTLPLGDAEIATGPVHDGLPGCARLSRRSDERFRPAGVKLFQ